MPRTELIKNSFIGGEISPRVLSRTDLANYHSACESISNFVVQVQGGVVRRSGIQYICDAAGPNRLIPFQVSPTQQYVLEAGQNFLRFYTNSRQIQTTPGSGVPYEIATPFALANMWDVHFCSAGEHDVSYPFLVKPCKASGAYGQASPDSKLRFRVRPGR